MTAPTYKLTYFPVCGRGGPLRQAFTIAGVDFEDERISFAEFGARKAADAFPYGMVPVLEVTTSL
jgi:prostaglandin-H2 D-isomerase / glutathione transferase